MACPAIRKSQFRIPHCNLDLSDPNYTTFKALRSRDQEILSIPV